jgi:hypothetical protein
VNLTFDVVTSKINRDHLQDITNQNVKYEDFLINNFQTMSGNHTTSLGPCDLDLWPSDSKVNRVCLRALSNHYMKYEDFVMNSF